MTKYAHLLWPKLTTNNQIIWRPSSEVNCLLNKTKKIIVLRAWPLQPKLHTNCMDSPDQLFVFLVSFAVTKTVWCLHSESICLPLILPRAAVELLCSGGSPPAKGAFNVDQSWWNVYRFPGRGTSNLSERSDWTRRPGKIPSASFPSSSDYKRPWDTWGFIGGFISSI